MARSAPAATGPEPGEPPDHADFPELLARATPPGLSLVTSVGQALRRVWLDTADHRVARSGAVLTCTTVGRRRELTLATKDGTLLTAAMATGAPRWPALLEAVPEGPLRQRLAPLVGIRALLPLAQGQGRRWDGRLVDDLGKTVARLRADAAVELETGTVAPGVTVIELRGYRAPAQALRRRLERAGLATDPYRWVVAGYPSPRRAPAVRYESRTPAAVGIAAMLERFAEEMDQVVPGTLADIDTEFLHDLRVAVRRSRSVVKLVGDVLPQPLVELAAAELRWLGDLTTPTRDLDVYLLDLPGAATGLQAAAPDDLVPFAEYLRRLRTRERAALRRGLRSPRLGKFQREYRSQLAAVTGSEPAGAAAVPLGRLAAERVARAHRRLRRLGDRITTDSPPEALHTLRKRGKELRYLLELFAPLFDEAALGGAIRELKALQDCLGRFQDGEVQQLQIQRLAGQMLAAGEAGAPTLLAMGELAAHRHRMQQEARAEFEQRYQRFRRPRVERRFAQLTAAGAQLTAAGARGGNGE